ncbi:hypothetical protein PU630_08465 [Microbacterium horticulturae]|uniref:Uncharacterized protein n=1 Tax=Microbacterium horticulturae TaxID=3028316 RepID=A0ABY8C276_9MICO|nr:hypothetical protein [Microbacterium sp. KACC 23027]WEG10555.1 hypothetical protein PU630_08465 [Microbacterium sp. KACC 23027]
MSTTAKTPATTEIVSTGVGLNPWATALVTVGGLAWLVSFMLWLVHSPVTDDLGYDVATATALTEWIKTLIVVGGVAFVGAITIAGVRHELQVHR